MDRARGSLLVRNVAFYAAALGLCVVFLPVAPLMLLPPRYHQGALDTYLGLMLRLLKSIGGIGHELRGGEHLGNGPAILAAVHQSGWDALFLPMLLRNPATPAAEASAWKRLAALLPGRKPDAPRPDSAEIARQVLAAARAQVAMARSVLVDAPASRASGAQGMPTLGLAPALYEGLALPCIPIAHNAGRFWEDGSWLLKPGMVIVDVLPPIAPGLEAKRFAETLTVRLEDATARMLVAPERPVLMQVPTAGARRLLGAMQAGGSAESA